MRIGDEGQQRKKSLLKIKTKILQARRYAPADGSSTRGGSTSVRGRVRSPHMAKLQAASVPIA